MHHHAVHGFQQRQFDEVLPLDETTGRRRCSDDQQRVAGVGIDQPVHRARIGERHGDVGERRLGDVAQHRQRQRRGLAAFGESQCPLGAVGAAFAFERGNLRPVEADADGLALLQRQPADVTDDGAALEADLFDIHRPGMVEHQPHRIGAAEQRGRGRRGKGEGDAQAVAVTSRLDGGGLVLGSGFFAGGFLGVFLCAFLGGSFLGGVFRRRHGCRWRELLRRLGGRRRRLGRRGFRRLHSRRLDRFGS